MSPDSWPDPISYRSLLTGPKCRRRPWIQLLTEHPSRPFLPCPSSPDLPYSRPSSIRADGPPQRGGSRGEVGMLGLTPRPGLEMSRGRGKEASLPSRGQHSR